MLTAAVDAMGGEMGEWARCLKEAAAEEPVPANWLDRTRARRLIVHLKTGQTLEGTVAEVAPDGVILRAARMLTPNNKHADMAGEVFVPRDNVLCTQMQD